MLHIMLYDLCFQGLDISYTYTEFDMYDSIKCNVVTFHIVLLFFIGVQLEIDQIL